MYKDLKKCSRLPVGSGVSEGRQGNMAGEDSVRLFSRNGESPKGIKEGSDVVRVGLRKIT